MTDDEIIQQYYPWLRKTAANLIGFDDPGLDDLIQEGYIAMWKALTTHDPDKGPLVPRLQYFARQRMVNLSYGHHQYTGHEPARGHAEAKQAFSLDGQPDPDYFMSKSPAADAGLPDEDVAGAVADLPDLQRQYVYLRFWVCGGVFGKSAGTNRAREEFPLLRNDKLWARARETLRQDPRMKKLAHLR